MAKLLVYYAHPGHRHSKANRAMLAQAKNVNDITLVDLYAEYPRFGINPDREQARLLAHDIILFQFPLFWYSTPSLLKEWQDIVLEHGWAYGADGDKLKGKTMMIALTAAGPRDAYSTDGYQGFELRTFLTPLERTAKLCHMEFSPPFVLFESLLAPTTGLEKTHAQAYRDLLQAVRDDQYDFVKAAGHDVVTLDTLPLLTGE